MLDFSHMSWQDIRYYDADYMLADGQATAQPEAEEEDSEAMRRQLDALLGQ